MGMSNRRQQSESPRRQFYNDALRLENFSFLVLILLAAIFLISRIWLMLH
jgi:hypothetical protein